jgi:lysosomal alpha-mannosidase
MGLAQHHDAVSGTEKQEVAYDYAQRLSIGIDAALVSSEFDKQLYETIPRLPLFLECY